MANGSGSSPEATPPHAQLVQMAMGHWVSRIVYVAAKLDIAGRLANGPKSADELAGPTATDATALYRFMRSLATLGILNESDNRQFSLTPLGEALKADAPGAARSSVLTIASDWWFRGFGELMYSVQTSKSGFEKALGEPIFDFLGHSPEDASLFSETMIGFHGSEAPAVAAAYDFSDVGTLADVGGASGHLLTTILQRYPKTRGILFDLPHVVCDAPALIGARGLTDRVEIQSGSFFDGVPLGADVYLLSHIIHDWREDLCLTILGQCRQAMKPGGRVLIIEMVLPPAETPHPGKLLDVMMLVGPGGQERTAPEYGVLLGKAGFRLNRVVPTASAVSVVEAVVA
jgi:hypothetical protein